MLRQSQLTGRLRLRHLLEVTEAKDEEMAAERARFARLADPGSAPRAVAAFNLFQTPEPLAARMARLLLDRVDAAAPVLEPSAGLGRLYRALRTAGHTGPLQLVEIAPQCAAELYRETAGDEATTLRQGDFLEMNCGLVAGVLMNPPFKQGRDVRHIRHALRFLRPGSRLVAMCFNGAKQQQLKEIATTWEVLPPKTFRESGTRAEAVLLTVDT